MPVKCHQIKCLLTTKEKQLITDFPMCGYYESESLLVRWHIQKQILEGGAVD